MGDSSKCCSNWPLFFILSLVVFIDQKFCMSYKEQLNEFATFNNHVKSVREGNVSKENV